MKDILYFMLGMTVGALMALLMAPKSGEELRSELQERTNVDLQKLQATYEQKLADVNKSLESIQAQLKKTQALDEAIAEKVGAEESA